MWKMFNLATVLLFVIWLTGLANFPFWFVLIPWAIGILVLLAAFAIVALDKERWP